MRVELGDLAVAARATTSTMTGCAPSLETLDVKVGMPTRKYDSALIQFGDRLEANATAILLDRTASVGIRRSCHGECESDDGKKQAGSLIEPSARSVALL
jgi:hypothetical protein